MSRCELQLADGRSRPVKNLGWLLRNWKSVNHFEFVVNSDGTGLLCAVLHQGNPYWRYFAGFESAQVMLEFVDRPVFQGVRATISTNRRTGAAPSYTIGSIAWDSMLAEFA